MSAANEPADRQAPHPGPTATVEARKLSGSAPSRETGADFSYSVLSNPGRAAAGERRSFTRQRTKLRSGKIVDSHGRFITECLIHNRSASGCRLRLPANVAVPSSLLFFEDQTERLFQAVVMWQRDRDVGIRLLPQASGGLNRSIAERMRRRFYVLPR